MSRLFVVVWLLASTLLLSTLGAPAIALAHPAVDAGVAAYEEADFERALALFEQAEAGDGMSAADLAILLEHRALAAQALGRDDEVGRALTALAELDPAHAFSARVPPTIVAAFAERARAQQAAVTVEAHATRTDRGVRVDALAAHDTAALVRTLRIGVRTESGWRVSLGASVTLSLEPTRALAYYAEAVGPGGALLAQHGSAESPLVLAAVPGSASSDDTWWHWLLAVGAVLVVGAGVGVGVAIASEPSSVQLPPPHVSG
ncbi:MAG: hypothetical protein K1X94_26780 [Sandaracinaceae bacterium]|nr:hypothetical protein [Sandaracinaceae bacterium]